MGFEALRHAVEKYTPENVEKITGIPASDLIATARLYAGAERASILYCMGITQHTTGTDNVKSLANLAVFAEWVRIEPLRGSPQDGPTIEIAYRVAWDEEHTVGARIQGRKVWELCGSVV